MGSNSCRIKSDHLNLLKSRHVKAALYTKPKTLGLEPKHSKSSQKLSGIAPKYAHTNTQDKKYIRVFFV